MIIKNYNLRELCGLIKQNEDNVMFKKWIDLLKIYETTLGGCSCNRKSRLENAEFYYETKMINLDKKDLEELKDFLKVDKIIFELDNKKVIAEI